MLPSFQHTIHPMVDENVIKKSAPITKLKERDTSIAIKLDALKTLVFNFKSLYQSITKRISQFLSVSSILKNLESRNNQYCSERLDNANQCEFWITNLNVCLCKWKGNDQEIQEVQTVVK